MLLCKHGVRPRSHLWFFANACYTRSSLEQDSPQTSPSRSRHRTKRWTSVLTILECGACTESILPPSLLLRGKNFLWLYWIGWKIRTALHDVHDDHGWVGESMLTSDKFVSLSRCLALVQQYLPLAYEETRRKKNIRTFHSRWEMMEVYFILYLSIKCLILCVWT